MTNKEQVDGDEEQSDIIEIDNRDSTGEQIEAVKVKDSRPLNTEAYVYNKSPIKLKNKCSLEPFSITSIILFSVLFGIVGAGKLESGMKFLKENLHGQIQEWEKETMKIY